MTLRERLYNSFRIVVDAVLPIALVTLITNIFHPRHARRVHPGRRPTAAHSAPQLTRGVPPSRGLESQPSGRRQQALSPIAESPEAPSLPQRRVATQQAPAAAASAPDVIASDPNSSFRHRTAVAMPHPASNADTTRGFTRNVSQPSSKFVGQHRSPHGTYTLRQPADSLDIPGAKLVVTDFDDDDDFDDD